MEDKYIEELIKCPKEFTKPPKRDFKLSQRDAYTLNNGFSCRSTDQMYYFEVYLKKNIKFKEKFSIGLIFYPRDASQPEKIMLIRCNGAHEHKNKILNKNEFSDFHIHTANETQMKLGFDIKFDAFPAEVYNNFDGALEYFMNLCNIQNWGNYFSIQDQSQLIWDI